MYGQPVVSQEWSVHAQLTISHRRPTDSTSSDIPPPQPRAAAPPDYHDSSGVQMQYSWGGQPTSPSPPMTVPASGIPPGNSYGFQRGNILFTTRPPPREHHVPAPHSVPTQSPVLGAGQNRLGTAHLLDSGYNSEQVSPGSYASLPTRRSAQPYSRRCKSTCSIVLSGTEHQGVSSASMRPNVDIRSSDYIRDSSDAVYYPSEYKCGDPVCYHHQSIPGLSTRQSNRPKSSDFAPLPETCEVCGGGRSPTAVRRASGANTFTTHFCTRVPERMSKESKEMDTQVMSKMSRDAASQTSEHLTSTIATSSNKNKPIQPKMGNKVIYGGTRRKTDSELLQLPVIDVPEPDNEVKKPTSGKRLSRSPAHRLSRSPARLRGQSPLLSKTGRKSRGSQCTPNEAIDTKGLHKPRTVHIDVYCTGSEDADASGSSDGSEVSDSWSSPQTVFESDKLKVVHARMGRDKLPAGYLQRQEQQQQRDRNTSIISRRSESFKYETTHSAEEKQHQIARGYDSDDGLSSHYPSQMSSYSTLQGATETSILQSEVATTTSQDISLSTISSSSIALSDEYDSAAATSWKDTTSGLESLLQSTQSLAQSDSFEYADAADRLRIREKERAWAGTEGKGDGSKTWRSPHVERKHLLQQQKFKEFLEKHLGTSPFPMWKPETTEDSDDDETGDAWSFCGQESQTASHTTGTTLKREDTVKRVNLEKNKSEKTSATSIKGLLTIKTPILKPSSQDTGSLSDSGPHRFIPRTTIGPFGSKLPSPPPSKVASSVTSPFTNVPGRRTDQLSRAEKFGTIVGAFRKPGHHIGPSKNPECVCEHCRKYYESKSYRTRTRSVGDMPLESVNCNWKTGVNNNQNKFVSDGASFKLIGMDSDLENSSITEDASTDNEKSFKHISNVVDSDNEDGD